MAYLVTNQKEPFDSAIPLHIIWNASRKKSFEFRRINLTGFLTPKPAEYNVGILRGGNLRCLISTSFRSFSYTKKTALNYGIIEPVVFILGDTSDGYIPKAVTLMNMIICSIPFSERLEDRYCVSEPNCYSIVNSPQKHISRYRGMCNIHTKLNEKTGTYRHCLEYKMRRYKTVKECVSLWKQKLNMK